MSGWKVANGALAVSSSDARCRTVDSASQPDTNCTPIGSPFRLVPNLIDNPGRPVTVKGTVAFWMSRVLSAAGVVGPENSDRRALAIAGAQLLARSRSDISLFDALIDSYRVVGLLPA